jgi:ADP-heptose:LPS heptosyltransferase
VAEVFIPFNQAMAALSFAKSYIGNDTSLLNLSGVLGVPSLGLFSQSKPLTYVKTIHHLDILKEQDYGKPNIIVSYQVADVFSWLDRNF